MDNDLLQNITEQGVQLVQRFFDTHAEEDDVVFPEILSSSGVWMAICDREAVGVFFLNEKKQQRVVLHKERGVHPFPGFMIGESERPPDQRASSYVTTPFRSYVGNQSSGAFAFSLVHDGSCVVVNHTHELLGSTGRKAFYTVDLAFLLGYSEEESAENFLPRLSALLDHCLSTWRSPHG